MAVGLLVRSEELARGAPHCFFLKRALPAIREGGTATARVFRASRQKRKFRFAPLSRSETFANASPGAYASRLAYACANSSLLTPHS